VNAGIGAVENDLPFAVRQYRVGQHEQVFRVRRQPFRHVVKITRGVDVQIHPQEVVIASSNKEHDLRVVAVQVAEAGRTEDHGIGKR
jgi:hypothetical protein